MEATPPAHEGGRASGLEVERRGAGQGAGEQEADGRGELEAGVAPGEQHPRSGERVQRQEARGGEEGERDEEDARIGTSARRFPEEEAEREREHPREDDEPEVRRVVLPADVQARLAEQEHEARHRQDDEGQPDRPPHSSESSARR
jgi:hypothetical protein